MKECKGCGEEKPHSEYYRHPATKDGYRPKCKVCVKKETGIYRAKNPHIYQAMRDARKGTMKYRAPVSLNLAVRYGKVTVPDKCSVCEKEGRVEAHHDDYMKPLDVRWLCSQCHSEWHTQNGEGRNANVPDVRYFA